ncbi:MAG: hypothetical protein RI911_859, partial [Candidatus Parcubacteria bacterium]
MAHRHISIFGSRMRGSLYELNFFVNVSMALMLFYLGPYAKTLDISASQFGLLTALASLLSIPGPLFIHRVTELLGVRKALLATTTVYAISLVGIALSNGFLPLLCFLAIAFTAIGFIVCFLDAYVSENTSHSHNTGSVRGIFLAASNIAYILAPLAAGLLIESVSFQGLFFIAALSMLPFFMISYRNLPNIPSLKESKHRHSIHKAIGRILKKQQLREVFIAQALYRIFSIVSISYIALYLTDSVGIAIALTSVVLMCMEIPYALVQVPLGKMIDGYWHEQSPAMIGFFIMAVTTALIPFSN